MSITWETLDTFIAAPLRDSSAKLCSILKNCTDWAWMGRNMCIWFPEVHNIPKDRWLTWTWSVKCKREWEVQAGMSVLQVTWGRYLRRLAFLLNFPIQKKKNSEACQKRQSDYFPLLKTSLWQKRWRVWPFKGHMGAQRGHWPSSGARWYSSGHLNQCCQSENTML